MSGFRLATWFPAGHLRLKIVEQDKNKTFILVPFYKYLSFLVLNNCTVYCRDSDSTLNCRSLQAQTNKQILYIGLIVTVEFFLSEFMLGGHKIFDRDIMSGQGGGVILYA